MKKIVSIAITVILACLTVCFSGCSESHDESTCPICTETVNSKYSNLLQMMKTLNPDAEVDAPHLTYKDYKEVHTLDELHESVMGIKHLLVPEIPEWTTEGKTVNKSFGVRENTDNENCGYVITYRIMDAEKGDIESISVQCGATFSFGDNLQGSPPYQEWISEMDVYEVKVQYYTKQHFTIQQNENNYHLPENSEIYLLFSDNNIDYAIHLSIKA